MTEIDAAKLAHSFIERGYKAKVVFTDYGFDVAFR